jgi:tetratricopeptide (TPR) repeat protein
MNNDTLSRANCLARRGNFDGAIKLLKAEEDRYLRSPLYYYLLGLCYLHTGVYGNALENFKLARQQKLRDPLILLGLAALYLNHGATDQAVDLYLEVQSLDEKNRIAEKGLNVIRRHPGPENIAAWIDSGKLHTLFPPLLPVKFSLVHAVLPSLGIIAVLCLAAFMLIKTGLVSVPFLSGQRKTMDAIELVKEEQDAPMQIGGSYRYVLTKNETLDQYNEARRLFTAYHDETAKRNLNRILESNASGPVKNKARLLLSYMEVPGFDTLKDRFNYAEVVKEPVLYRDCYVIWRGMASNLEHGQTHTSFDFLVGYDTRRTLDGIVKVDFDFAIAVNPERPLEVLGRIIPISAEKGQDIRIQGVALNQAGLLEGEK